MGKVKKMNIEPEIEAISNRLCQFHNTVCTDDLINYLGVKAEKTTDISELDSIRSHKEKIMELGCDKLIDILNNRGMNVSIRMSLFGYPIIEFDGWEYVG